jgi:hypothetical protein
VIFIQEHSLFDREETYRVCSKNFEFPLSIVKINDYSKSAKSAKSSGHI